MIYAICIALVTLTVFSTVNVNAQQFGGRCRVNEARLPCGRECEDRCNSPRPKRCQELQCPTSGCRCRDGFFRNPYTNRCVNRGECVDDGCVRGEISATCGKTCEGTCESPRLPEMCRRIFCEKRECRCDLGGGFVRNTNGLCVRVARC